MSFLYGKPFIEKIDKNSPLADKLVGGTSFHGKQISTSIKALREAFGDETYQCAWNDYSNGDGKVTHEWYFIVKDDNGQLYATTLYDWKYYREIGVNEVITWNIGSINKDGSEIAQRLLLERLGVKATISTEHEDIMKELMGK